MQSLLFGSNGGFGSQATSESLQTCQSRVLLHLRIGFRSVFALYRCIINSFSLYVIFILINPII